jgi:hypothetical protein
MAYRIRVRGLPAGRGGRLGDSGRRTPGRHLRVITQYVIADHPRRDVRPSALLRGPPRALRRLQTNPSALTSKPATDSNVRASPTKAAQPPLRGHRRS